MGREAKEVLGKNGANLWLLTIVLVATFTSIAFSEGSMNYLEDKMADPFTNWVSIKKDNLSDEKFNKFRERLHLQENAEHYDYQGVLMDQYLGLNIQGPQNGRIEYLSIRFFEHIHSSIVNKILDKENVVEGCLVDSTILIDKTLGFIITLDALKKIGYSSDNLPAYIHYLSPVSEEHAYDLDFDSLGLQPLTLGNTKYLRIALPILAIVRKLPNNVDMVSTNFFYEQYHYNFTTSPFAVTAHQNDYLHHLYYWVSNEVSQEEFEKKIKNQNTKLSDFSIYGSDNNCLSMKSWKGGKMLNVDVGGEHLPIERFIDVDNIVKNKWDENQVQRIYMLETMDSPSPRSDYLSVEFHSLKHIREFEAFAKTYGISLEMEQVHSKENFNAVTVMASILSTAMVIFSIICIIMFLVNMLQSYFQKVSKNIGTFKAFGMNTQELIQTYEIMLLMIVFSAVIMALMITWGIQGILPVIGIEKEGFNYLSLWNTTTYIATIVVIVSTIATVSIVMSRMLSRTPGDLIYDRN